MSEKLRVSEKIQAYGLEPSSVAFDFAKVNVRIFKGFSFSTTKWGNGSYESEHDSASGINFGKKRTIFQISGLIVPPRFLKMINPEFFLNGYPKDNFMSKSLKLSKN